jgi:hypothetical protein
MLKEPLLNSSFTLDLSGVAGFFGGDVAVQAMATVHVYQGRKWLGWYNTPGSYEIARRYGQLCKARFWDGVYPGVNVDPAVFFELDGKDGPSYRGVHSGTVLPKTGHIAYLLQQRCKDIQDPVRVEGRRPPSVPVTIVTLSGGEPKKEPRIIRRYSSVLAAIPILATLATAVLSAVCADWYCFSMIMLGCISGGLSCLVLGTGSLQYGYPKPSEGSPPGDGLLDGGSQMIVLLGSESAVNAVTKGAFTLKFSSEPQYNNIGYCSLLLTIQFVAQLLLVPQGRLFGQLMFLTSLSVSWGYNMYLCSIDPEVAQQEIMMTEILCRPSLQKFLLPTRTVTVVFVLLILSGRSAIAVEDDVVKGLLNVLLPNDTPVWRLWKEFVVPKVTQVNTLSEWCSPIERTKIDEKAVGFNAKDRGLLNDLLNDAQKAYETYLKELSSTG